jgi:ribosomal protein S18 acetylase RimI-like enzyme
MRWRTVADADDAELRRLLTDGEPATTVMSDKLRSGRLDRRLRRGGRFYALEHGDQYDAVVYHGPGGFFYPYGIAERAYHTALIDDLKRKSGSFVRLHSIMGTRSDVDALAAVFGARARNTIDYELLSIGPDEMPDPENAPLSTLSLVDAEERHWKQLLTLQTAYEIEEVLPVGTEPNLAHSKALLRDSLVNHTVLVALNNDTVVARVATNAHGFLGEQIGGVYTEPRLRGRGIARWLMTHLLARLKQQGLGASLFVKAHNEVALGLYKNLGFTFVSMFRIRYY